MHQWRKSAFNHGQASELLQSAFFHCAPVLVTEEIPVIIKKFKPTYFINKNLQTLSEYKDVIQSRISAAVNKSLKLHSGSL